jgi:tryptophan 2,3-dioxygenase
VSDTLIAAIFSVVAVVILAPIANHLFIKYRERRSIVATLRVHEAPLPTLLRTHFQDFRSKAFVQTSPGSFNPRQLDVLYFLKGYMKLTLLNPSKKKAQRHNSDLRRLFERTCVPDR